MLNQDHETSGSMFREQRAAKNQSLFREVNERIKPLNESFSFINRTNDFVCECANDGCTEMISLSVEEYEWVRAEPNRFFVAPNDEHVWDDVERVVEERDRYWIVEKVGYAATIAEKLNPRSREI